jgi:hypothetical protein
MNNLQTDLTGYNVMEHHEVVKLTQNGEVTTTEKHTIQAVKSLQFQSGRDFEGTFAVSLQQGNTYFMQVNVPTRPDMTMEEWDEHGTFVMALREKGNQVKAEVSSDL